ncbi:hypothetical protein Hanom_Chr12g01071511 [Helianthus anomalus]
MDKTPPRVTAAPLANVRSRGIIFTLPSPPSPAPPPSAAEAMLCVRFPNWGLSKFEGLFGSAYLTQKRLFFLLNRTY